MNKRGVLRRGRRIRVREKGFKSGFVETFFEVISAESSYGCGEGGGDGRGRGPNFPYPSSTYASSARSITPRTTIPTAAISSQLDGVWDEVAHDVGGGQRCVPSHRGDGSRDHGGGRKVEAHDRKPIPGLLFLLRLTRSRSSLSSGSS